MKVVATTTDKDKAGGGSFGNLRSGCGWRVCVIFTRASSLTPLLTPHACWRRSATCVTQTASPFVDGESGLLEVRRLLELRVGGPCANNPPSITSPNDRTPSMILPICEPVIRRDALRHCGRASVRISLESGNTVLVGG